jgi:hypothetical protein
VHENDRCAAAGFFIVQLHSVGGGVRHCFLNSVVGDG